MFQLSDKEKFKHVLLQVLYVNDEYVLINDSDNDEAIKAAYEAAGG